MRIAMSIVLLLSATASFAQTVQPSGQDPFQPLAFLEGSWIAKASGPSNITADGTYTFQPELANHILARHSIRDGACKGPAGFDCDHGDLLYVYRDSPAAPLKAIYFDNEGHVLHYNVTTPSPTTAVFLSIATNPGPQFRLVYELKGTIMYGKFQMRMPDQEEWKSYLEWSGPKK